MSAFIKANVGQTFFFPCFEATAPNVFKELKPAARLVGCLQSLVLDLRPAIQMLLCHYNSQL